MIFWWEFEAKFFRTRFKCINVNFKPDLWIYVLNFSLWKACLICLAYFGVHLILIGYQQEPMRLEWSMFMILDHLLSCCYWDVIRFIYRLKWALEWHKRLDFVIHWLWAAICEVWVPLFIHRDHASDKDYYYKFLKKRVCWKVGGVYCMLVLTVMEYDIVAREILIWVSTIQCTGIVTF